jgi:hypothetical protein
MAEKHRWVLTDVEKGTWVESLKLSAKELGMRGASAASVRKRVLRGGLSDGVDVVEVNNGVLSFVVVPTRGMGLWKGEYKGNAIGWDSPVQGPVNPMFVHANERGGLGWLGGFDECIVRCGLESNGSPGTDIVPNNMGDPTEMTLCLHGRIANIPARYVAVEVLKGNPPELCITGIVDEAMLFCPQLRLITRIRTRIGSNAFTISDEIVNLKSTDSEMQMLYHCNFGKPFMDKGARLIVPASETAPRSAYPAKEVEEWSLYQGPIPGFIEQCFWHVPIGDSKGNTVALLRNAAGNKGVAVRFNVNQLPCFTQWKNTGAESDGYVTGLEPAVNYPNSRVFERKQGRVIKMAPGQKYRIDLTVEVCGDARGVQKLEQEIGEIQGKRPRKLNMRPLTKFSQQP